MKFFTLDCGRSVSVDSFHFDYTYSNILEGKPNRYYHQIILEQATEKTTKLYGTQKTHLTPPQVDESDPEHPVLPQVRMWIELVCYDPIDPNYMASYLIVMCYRDRFNQEALEDIIYSAIRSLNWDELAQDFDW